MKNRVKIFIWLLTLVTCSQVQALSFFELIQAVPNALYGAAEITVAGSSILVSYFANNWINHSKNERKRERQALAHQEHLQQVSDWSSDQFDKHLRERGTCNEFNQVTASCLFEQYSYYQFPAFQDLLMQHPLFEASISNMRREIKNGKKFEFYTRTEEDKFEDAVHKLVNIVNDRITAQRLEAQETQRRVEPHRLKQEKQNLYKQHVNITLNQEKDEHNLLCEYYAQEIEFIEHSENQIPKELELDTMHSLLILKARMSGWSSTMLCLRMLICCLMNMPYIPADYMHCYGNQIQQVVHKELIAILEGTAQLRYVNLLDQDIKAVTTTITLFANAGRLHNHAGHIPAAISFADFCWNALDVCQPFMRGMIEGCLWDFKCCYPCGVAGVRGAWKGTKNFGNTLVATGRFCRDAAYSCSHPIESARIVCSKIKACAEFIAQRMAEGRAEQEKLIKSNSPLFFYWHIPTKQEIALQESRHKEIMDLTIKAAHQFLEHLPTYLTPEAMEHSIEKSTEIATEMALSYATGRAIGAMAQAGAHALASSLEGVQFVREVPATMGSMQACIVLELLKLKRQRLRCVLLVMVLRLAVMCLASWEQLALG